MKQLDHTKQHAIWNSFQEQFTIEPYCGTFSFTVEPSCGVFSIHKTLENWTILLAPFHLLVLQFRIEIYWNAIGVHEAIVNLYTKKFELIGDESFVMFFLFGTHSQKQTWLNQNLNIKKQTTLRSIVVYPKIEWQ